MNEAEWLTCDDPERMLREIGLAASIRKLRLFMCTCCRRVWEDIQEPYCRVAVEVTEKYLEGEATDDEFESAADNVEWAWSLQRSDGCIYAEEAATYPTVSDPFEGAIWCVHCILDSCRSTKDSEAAAHASLLRCIFGNPFRPVGVLSEWRTDTVLGLSRQVYDSRDFSTLPILADALQDAGCDNEDVLNHCRGPGPHCRGCWVVDKLLGKE